MPATRVLNWMHNRFESLHTVYEAFLDLCESQGITLRYINFADFCACLARFDFDHPRAPGGAAGGRELITDFLDERKNNLVDLVLKHQDVDDPLALEAEEACRDEEEKE